MGNDEIVALPFEEESVDTMFPQLLKRAHVLHMLQVSEPTLRAWVRDGKLKSIRIGTCERFAVEDIRRLVMRGKNHRTAKSEQDT